MSGEHMDRIGKGALCRKLIREGFGGEIITKRDAWKEVVYQLIQNSQNIPEDEGRPGAWAIAECLDPAHHIVDLLAPSEPQTADILNFIATLKVAAHHLPRIAIWEWTVWVEGQAHTEMGGSRSLEKAQDATNARIQRGGVREVQIQSPEGEMAYIWEPDRGWYEWGHIPPDQGSDTWPAPQWVPEPVAENGTRDYSIILIKDEESFEHSYGHPTVEAAMGLWSDNQLRSRGITRAQVVRRGSDEVEREWTRLLGWINEWVVCAWGPLCDPSGPPIGRTVLEISPPADVYDAEVLADTMAKYRTATRAEIRCNGHTMAVKLKRGGWVESVWVENGPRNNPTSFRVNVPDTGPEYGRPTPIPSPTYFLVRVWTEDPLYYEHQSQHVLRVETREGVATGMSLVAKSVQGKAIQVELLDTDAKSLTILNHSQIWGEPYV